MFGWSVKSVPGCLVLIAPNTIGDPLALTPGLGPQDEVLTLPDPPLLLLLPPLEDEPPGGALVLDELLLPHAASATSAASETTTATAIRSRARGTSRSVLTSPPRV